MSSTITTAPVRVPRAAVGPPVVVVAVLMVISGLAYLARETVFEAVAGAGESVPDGLRPAVVAFCEWGPVAMVLVAGAAAVVAWLAGRRTLVVGAVLGAGGAYLISELAKVLVREDRPCRSTTVPTLLECPQAGDWSWPSNHATVAGALAVACVFAVRRLVYLVVPLAAVVALARVVGGVHYLHDVTAGLALGVLVTLLVVAASGGLRDDRRSRGRARGR